MSEMMAKIIEFPNKKKERDHRIGDIKLPPRPLNVGGLLAKLFRVIIDVVWVVTALFFPILSWIIALDCVFQFIRMIYYWHDKNIHAGITFSLHFAFLVFLNVFVMLYKPKNK